VHHAKTTLTTLTNDKENNLFHTRFSLTFICFIFLRFGETSPIPRYMAAFYEKYHDTAVWDRQHTGIAYMYKITFRILETLDEHFYYYRFYHWPFSWFWFEGQGSEKSVSKNAKKILKR